MNAQGSIGGPISLGILRALFLLALFDLFTIAKLKPKPKRKPQQHRAHRNEPGVRTPVSAPL